MDTWWPKGKRFARLEKVIFIFVFLDLVPPSQFSAFVQLVSFFFFFSPLNLSLAFHVRISIFFSLLLQRENPSSREIEEVEREEFSYLA
jgi:hypothetical protein